MQMLHASAGPNRASDPELLFDTCRTFIPAPFAINGKSAPLGTTPWALLRGHSIQPFIGLDRGCARPYMAGLSFNSASGKRGIR
jgi:hypothetical protein